MRERVGRSLAAGLFFLAGCYELPPRPPDYDSQPLRPPFATYTLEPLHPANRWFHRAFAPRDQLGQPLDAPSDLPFSLLAAPTAVDRAELLALLEALVREGLPDETGRVSRALLHADLLAESRRWQTRADGEDVALEHLAAARAFRPAQPERLRVPFPPPLESGEWAEVTGDLPSVHASAPLVWSRIFYQFGEPIRSEGAIATSEAPVPVRAVALCQRLIENADGELARSALGSECWLLERGGGAVEPRLWRFDRAAWLHYELVRDLVPDADRAAFSLWREVPQGEVVQMVSSGGSEDALLEGSMRELCLSCHPPANPFRTRREGFVVDLGTAKSEEEE